MSNNSSEEGGEGAKERLDLSIQRETLP